MDDVSCKTAVNTRETLAARLPKKKAVATHANASLHQKAETTYDTTYTAAPAERASVAAHASQNLAGSCDRSSQADAEATWTPDDDTVRRQQKEDQRRGYKVVSCPSSEWESTSHAASRNVQPEQQLDFYATTRKVEQVDDDNRGGLVGRVQRSLEIRTKRAEDATLRPAAPSFPNTHRRIVPPIVAVEFHGAKHNYLDLVECTQLKPHTEEQIGFSAAPLTRLPGETLSQDLKVQSKVITEMGTSHELFRGTSKCLSDTPVGYTGYVPMSERNAAAIHHGDDAQRLFAKSHMTLAEHGGNVDLPPSASNMAARRRKGRNAPSPKALAPKSTESINRTAEGRVLQTSLYGTLERERQMNIRDDAQSQNYF
ncbi:hypothetical protein ABB37_07656 [Leptomonas pyrrhocoris]|uniref:Uncharacterized protein n=1 Tax=Leptomonas pyrrhocoris TaxID=157538 RepID=A0A0M9FVD9_LEPPY|nr:hypothetical protein ABB37_07656 [Leptomonas pyrrhocoris]XP_015655300.1 hypothetical protein ABB37_07656 [Leptomonas pyrrhocoris]KPA76860.1 hypothetical protein ABB37_07656 [Leptomonas pyrrhocoris]KPA76861.1 hypothetical protein ABB37_07656 [Leptomonas pyrrhocoris]|eukprot:XP_015655299.1 hypothetical protein ABB37_07656 [Leptomonas pyrrhocoris]